MSQAPPAGEGMIDAREAIDRFIALTAIQGRSGRERGVADHITAELRRAGVPPSAIVLDDATDRTPDGGDCGNLIVSLDGDRSLPRTLLSAHMDTVPVCLDCDPVETLRDGRPVITAAGQTGLGADDRSGCAVVLGALIARARRLADHPEIDLPPVVATFLIQEEIGLQGARCLDRAKVGPVDQAFNFDGGDPAVIRHGAIGGERMEIDVDGYASHAGVAPAAGISAITIAAVAIASLHRDGWLGAVQKDGGVGTANVGVIAGGEATNVVTPHVHLKAEARSHDSSFRAKIVAQIRGAFERAAAAARDQSGRRGRVRFQSGVDYEAFCLAENHPSVVAAMALISATGRQPRCEVANGGLDANWLHRHGIDAVTLGCGQGSIHTTDEYLDVQQYLDACQVACRAIGL